MSEATLNLPNLEEINRALAETVTEEITKNEKLTAELALVDEALARRPALDKYKTRYEKICAACETASRAEPTNAY